jgi:hypothetical protein
MGYLCLGLMFILVKYCWPYIKFDIYLSFLNEIQVIKNISNDDMLQQERLFELSKNLLYSSLLNLTLLMISFSPFIVLYSVFGGNYIYLLLTSTKFWILCTIFFLILLFISRNK